MVIDDQGNRKIVYPKPPSGAGSVAQAAAAAVSAPSGSGPTTPGAIPGEGIYQEQQLLAQKAYDEAVNGLSAQRKSIFQQYGFNTEGTADPNNPLGLYQQMRRSHAIDLEGADENRLSRGLSAAGLGAQAESRMRYDQDVEDAGLMRDYLGALGQNDQGKLSAAQALQQALLQARQQQIADALQAQAWTQPAYDDGPASVSAPAVMAAARTVAAAKKKVEQPWEKALRLRSEALQRGAKQGR